MAYQFHHQRGEWWRSGFVCLRDSYHGDTLGSVSVGGIELFHSLYRPLLFDAWQAPSPATPTRCARCWPSTPSAARRSSSSRSCRARRASTCTPTATCARCASCATSSALFLICDEVATGFGRTGTMFACEQEGVAPDLMCVAKGLTGGYLPLAATLTTERIYEGFLGRHEQFRTFFHGHTYTGNPLACAAALATLAHLRAGAHARAPGSPRSTCSASCSPSTSSACPRCARSAGAGSWSASSSQGFPLEARIGHRVTLEARARGAIIRPLGDTVVLMPPLSIQPAELRRLVEITAAAIAAAAGAQGLAAAA